MMQTTEKYPRGVVRGDAVSSAPKLSFIKDGRNLIQVVKAHIVYLTSDDHVCNLFLCNRHAPLVISRTFKDLLTALGDVLTYVRRGRAVNMHYVSSISDGHVHIQSECHNLNIACSKDALDAILASIEVV